METVGLFRKQEVVGCVYAHRYFSTMASTASDGAPPAPAAGAESAPAWWHAGPNSAQVGPMQLEDLHAALKDGKIHQGTLVWGPGVPQWVPYSAAFSQSTSEESASDTTGAAQTTAGTAGAEWFYAGIDGERHGPIPLRSFHALAAKEAVHVGTLVWHASLPEWMPATAVPQVAELLEAAAAAEASNASTTQKLAEEQEAAAAKQRGQKRKRATAPGCVYVQGCPPDVTAHEIAQHFSRCGIIKQHPLNDELNIKIYRKSPGDEGVQTGVLPPCKGDVTVQYLREPSVQLAVTMLDGVPLRPEAAHTQPAAAYKLSVQPAAFAPKEFTATGSKAAAAAAAAAVAEGPAPKGGVRRAKLTEKERKVLNVRGKEQDALLSWAGAGETDFSAGGAKIVILRGMFSHQEGMQGREVFGKQVAEDVRSECDAKCGPVERVNVYWSNPDGVVMVKFRTAGGAAECLRVMRGRSYGGQEIGVGLYDGVTDFRGEEEKNKKKTAGGGGAGAAGGGDGKRIDEFGAWIEGGGEDEDKW